MTDNSEQQEKACTHVEWISRPVGYVPTHWMCTSCAATITAGEMVLLVAINQLKAQIQEASP